MSDQWQEGMCNETSGFLFRHPCDGIAVQNCAMCNKPICSDHTTYTETSMICTTCAKGHINEQNAQDPQNQACWRGGYQRHDPYFYGMGYYSGYGNYGHGSWGNSHYSTSRRHDSSDFTEADAESLHSEDDHGFEQDMGES